MTPAKVWVVIQTETVTANDENMRSNLSVTASVDIDVIDSIYVNESAARNRAQVTPNMQWPMRVEEWEVKP